MNVFERWNGRDFMQHARKAVTFRCAVMPLHLLARYRFLPATLHVIIRQAGLTVDEFIALLD